MGGNPRHKNPLAQFKVASATNAQGSGFLLKTQQHCFQGEEEEGKNRSATKFRKNAPQERNFLNSFVQDCRLFSKNTKFKIIIKRIA